MSFEPDKFFIGVVDLFSILLPGGALTLALQRTGKLTWILPAGCVDSAEQWVILLFVSYVLGHFLFMIGSVLDGKLYDRLRNATIAGQAQQLARGKKLSPWLLRWSAGVIFGSQADAAVQRATALRLATSSTTRDAMNTFQWCKAKLALEASTGLALVNRFEADSKFFRSFVLLLAAGALVTFWEHGAVSAWLAILTVLAIVRYVNQRFKATQQAYWLVLAKTGAPAVAAAARRAGGVVIRGTGSATKYLLVKSKDGSEWVLPKGHVEGEETSSSAAIREVREEAGVWATIAKSLGTVDFESNGEKQNVEYFAMKCVREEGRAERESQWLSLDDAIKATRHSKIHEVLRLASADLGWLSSPSAT